MRKPLVNYAFIDGQNLNLSIREMGGRLDFQKFRVYLSEKYGVKIAYYFIGYVDGNSDLYKAPNRMKCSRLLNTAGVLNSFDAFGVLLYRATVQRIADKPRRLLSKALYSQAGHLRIGIERRFSAG